MLHKTLREKFGFETFLAGQKKVVERILASESVAAIFPTGAGKSLCYQLPALHLKGLTLVVSPLLSLMKDQVDFLAAKNIAAAKLDSGMSREDYLGTLQAARSGKLKILMISVERFKNERFRLQLGRMKISLMVVDEAHCISEWGHNFRPDYIKIPAYRHEFNIPQVLLLTATATPKVTGDMCRKFDIPKANVVTTGFFRPNLSLRVVASPAAAKTAALIEALAHPPAGAAIVYVIQQKTAERVAEMLADRGLKARAYHAGMKPEERESTQNSFMSDRLDIVVATIAFGMGIDKRNIRKVIHYDLPKSIESYSQEIGRAGRDGKRSVCSVLGDRASVPVLENFVHGDTPERTGLIAVLERIQRSATKTLEIRLTALSNETDIRLLPLKTLLVYLELQNLIRPKYVYFEDYPFKCIQSKDTIATNFHGERKAFVEAIFANAPTAKVWTRPDITAIAAATGSTRQRVIAALDYFEQNGWIELQPKSSVEVFEVLNVGFDVQETADRLLDIFTKRESQEIRRIQGLIDLLEAPSCLAAGLSEYFGEKLPQPCGVCTPCRSAKPLRLPEAETRSSTALDFDAMLGPLFDKLDPPVSAIAATRFLCGINTPKLTKIKARSMKSFGCLASQRYSTVLGWVQVQMKNRPCEKTNQGNANEGYRLSN